MEQPGPCVCHFASGSEPTVAGRLWRVSAAVFRVYEEEEAEYRATILQQILSVRCNLHSFSATTYLIPYRMEHVGHETDDDESCNEDCGTALEYDVFALIDLGTALPESLLYYHLLRVVQTVLRVNQPLPRDYLLALDGYRLKMLSLTEFVQLGSESADCRMWGTTPL